MLPSHNIPPGIPRDGSGDVPRMADCPKCGGKGVVTDFTAMTTDECDKCEGTGEVEADGEE